MSDLISRQAAIDALEQAKEQYFDRRVIIGKMQDVVSNLPSAQSKSYKEKLKEIADALSEKFAYMNTCLNERDIILGYLGVKRPGEIHCNTDCTNIKCESHYCYKKTPSAQPEQRWIPCSERLPEESGRYLVTNTQWGTYHVDWNIYYVNVEGHCDGWLWEQGCIAWMPLPEPYRGERTED